MNHRDGAAKTRSREEGAATDVEVTAAFAGRHLIASYHGCDYGALTDVDRLTGVFRAGIEAAGATLLQEASQVLPPNGLIAVLLLSESHASIHTYPEKRCCFVDLFTWGQRCEPDRFDAALVAYLRPHEAHRRLFVRDREEGI
jgi:S-adenosylmethionine decarboxylase proenzyme